MPSSSPFPGGPPAPGMPGSRLPFFNDNFFRPPYHFGMLPGHKTGDLGSRPHLNGFPFPPTAGSHLPQPPHHRLPFFPRIHDEFSARSGSQPCFNQVPIRWNLQWSLQLQPVAQLKLDWVLKYVERKFWCMYVCAYKTPGECLHIYNM
jgi:hypothetical protein